MYRDSGNSPTHSLRKEISMTSSGIKRGLASTAIAALAVAGLPFLASSASALDEGMTLVTTGPLRNGGTLGGAVVLTVSGATLADIDSDSDPTNGLTGSKLKLKASDLTAAAPFGAAINATASRFAPTTTPGTYTVLLYVTASTPSDGTAVSYAVYLDNGTTVGTVEGREARTQVTSTTTGVPTSIEVTPASLSAPQNVLSDAYTGSLKDAGGRVTQLSGAETLDLGAAGNTTISVRDEPSNPLAPAFGSAPPVGTTPATGVTSLGASKVTLGTFGFKASDPDVATATIPVALTGATATAKSVNLVVTKAVTGLTAADIDVVTGADSWNGFGGGAFGVAKAIRTDQTAIKVDVSDANDATNPKLNGNATMSVTYTGSGGITFGGKTSVTKTVTLDDAAKGFVTADVDAASITDAGVVTITSAAWAGNLILNYARPSAQTPTTDSPVYVTKIGQPTTVVVTVKDQFGNPVASPAQVSITRTPVGPRTANAGTTARQTVDSTGQATFTLPDAGTTAGDENLTFNVFDDALDSVAVTSGAAKITYTTDGLGLDFGVAGITTDPAANVDVPMTDAVPTDDVDAEVIDITGGTPNASATISVDGSAVVMAVGGDLAHSAASKTISLDGTGAGQVVVAGTKTGVITMTVTSAGRTKTSKFTVKQDGTVAGTARNIAITGPDHVAAGSSAAFSVTVTDAFGNPVPGVTAANLGITVNGPGNIQSTDAVTNASGVLVVNVLMTDNANSALIVRAAGTGAQFGKPANSVVVANDAPGITASQSPTTFTVTDVRNIAELQKAVDDAQKVLDTANDSLATAQGDKTVAVAKQDVARAAVNNAEKDVKWAKKHHKGVKVAKAALRAAKGDKKVADAEVKAANNVVKLWQARVAAAEEALAAAEAELAAAQG